MGLVILGLIGVCVLVAMLDLKINNLQKQINVLVKIVELLNK